MKKFIFCCSGIIIMFSYKVTAQQSLPSPDGLALIRNIQTPVDYSTGIASVHIPLLNFASYGLEVPISISYNASGIKVQDRSSTIGIGWKLNAGGRITRIVKKYPDEKADDYPWGYYHYDGVSAENLFKETFYWLRSKYNYYNEPDTEKDIYYFELPDRAGIFVLDSEGIGHTIPHQSDLYISFKNNSWLLKKTDGTEYRFGDMPRSTEYTTVKSDNKNVKSGKEEFSYTSCWHLTSIVNYVGEAIRLHYESSKFQVIEETNYIMEFELIEGGFENQVKHKSTTANVTRTETMASVLRSISTQEKIVNFNYDETIDKIRSIDIHDTAAERWDIYSIVLTYSGGQRSDYRHFLYNIEYVSGSEVIPVCNFKYERPLPTQFHFENHDYWGYFNTDLHKSYMPKNKWFSGYDDTDRSPNLLHTKNGILKSIEYPQGGKIDYEYELNTVNDRIMFVDDEEVGGLRIKAIHEIDKSGNTNTTRFFYEKDGRSSGTRMYKPIDCEQEVGNINISSGIITTTRHITLYSRPINIIYDFSGRNVIYSDVKVVNDDGSYVKYEYTTKHDAGCDDLVNDVYMSVNNEKNYTNVSQNTGNLQRVNYFPKDTRFWRRGLLKTISQYNNEDQLIRKEEYKYNFKNVGDSFKSYISAFDSWYIWTYRYLCENKLQPQAIMLSQKNVFDLYDIDSETKFYYDNNFNLKRTVTNRGDDEFVTKINYVSDLNEISYTNTYNEMSKQGLNFPMEVIEYKNGKIIEANLSTYHIYLLHSGLKYLPQKKYSLDLIDPIDNLNEIRMDNYGLVFDPAYKSKVEYYNYDMYGKVLGAEYLPGEYKSQRYISSYVYNKNRTQVIAEVSNAMNQTEPSYIDLTQVIYTSFEDQSYGYLPERNYAKTGRKAHYGVYTIDLSILKGGEYTVTYWLSKDLGETWNKHTFDFTNNSQISTLEIGENGCYLDELRIIPPNARIKTYTYDNFMGKTSESDHDGNTTYWEYDNFGRVTRILNNEKETLTSYEYNVPRY